MFNIHLPGFIYRTLPWMYICAGVATMIKLASALGTVSGLLLIVAGILVLKWRSRGTTGQRARAASRPRKLRAHRSGRTARASRPARSPLRRDDTAPAFAERTAAIEEATQPVEKNDDDNPQSVPPGSTDTDRRSDTPDRRSWQPMPRTPFFDSKGVLVTKDRRKTPDRRRGNIIVEEL